MDDLAQFLRDRLDEDEQAARAAAWDEADSLHWTTHHREQYDGRWVIVDRLDDRVTEVSAEASEDGPVAVHIARHDPARVLAEVDAKRRRLARHTPERRRLALNDEGGTTSFAFLVCTSCMPNRAVDTDQQVVVEWPCPDLLDDAAVYTDHPDHRVEWSS